MARWSVLLAKAERTKPAMRTELPRIATNLSLFSLTRGPTSSVMKLQVARKTENMVAWNFVTNKKTNASQGSFA